MLYIKSSNINIIKNQLNYIIEDKPKSGWDSSTLELEAKPAGIGFLRYIRFPTRINCGFTISILVAIELFNKYNLS